MKHLVPMKIRRPLRQFLVALRRLQMWRHISNSIKGATPNDSKTLRRAIWRSVRTVWSDLESWQFPMVDSDCSVVSKGIGVFQVRAQTDDLFHVMPMQEPAVEKAIRSLLRTGDTFVDAGANIGFYSVLGSKLVGPHGCVVALEMIPETAAILRSHVSGNDCANVEVIEGALADVSGVMVHASVIPGKSGQASIARNSEANKVNVKTVTLAECLTAVHYVRLMKMDLEGAEMRALEGLNGNWEKIHAIIFENRDGGAVVDYVKAHGFKVTALDGNNAVGLRVGSD